MKHVWPTRLDGVTSYQFQRYLVADPGSAQCVKLPIDFCRQLSSLLKNAHVSMIRSRPRSMYPKLFDAIKFVAFARPRARRRIGGDVNTSGTSAEFNYLSIPALFPANSYHYLRSLQGTHEHFE